MTTDSTMTDRLGCARQGGVYPETKTQAPAGPAAGEWRTGTILPDDLANGEEHDLPDPVTEWFLRTCLGMTRAEIDEFARRVPPRTFTPGKREWDRCQIEGMRLP